MTMTQPSRCLVSALAVTASLVAAGASRSSAADMTADELARALQRRYDSIKDFSADFVHSYRGGVLHKPISERGHVLIKKPGKMRWEYVTPEKKLFVADGVRMYSYLPEDKQVMVSAVPRDEQATAPALFLAGKGNLARDFTPSLINVPAGSPGGRALKLVPKSPQPDYDWLVLTLDPASLAILGLVTMDAQGGQSAFSFANLKENIGLADKEFAFNIPRGVDVVTDAQR
jgi:outer membrane lipoprotein carrier protein